MTTISYENFDLLIDQTHDGAYRARVVYSPAGDASVDFRLPFSEGELRSFFWLSGRVFRDLRLEPDAPEPGPLTPQEFGTRLYQEVFAGQVGTCLLRSLDAVSEGAGLRIRLRLDRNVPELADLPWEFLYAPDLGRFIVLSGQTVIARYVELPQRQQPLRVTPPLRILAMVSDPSDAPTLNVEREWGHLQAALADLRARGLVTLERLERATLPALQDRLRGDDVHILHFIGHGYFDEDAASGGLLLEDENRRGHRVDADRLATLLHDHASLRLVFLNACEGARGGRGDFFAGTAQRLVSQKTPAVIAMQFEVSDRAAINLAQEFYKAIADGYPVDAALAEARKAVYAGGDNLEWGTPVLFSRSSDNQILELPTHIETQSFEPETIYIPTGPFLMGSAPGPGIPYMAPSLPPHYVPRETELAEVRAVLLGKGRQVAVTALRGMGGVGKTTLAIALCHDQQVINAFLDGILWATLGPQADTLSAQATWGEALGLDLSGLPDTEARTARLRSLLHDKRCLLVLDDIWDTTHLLPMQVGGPQCATLVTTRERKVAQKVGMAHDLDVLEPEQAVALLEQWASEIVEDEKAVAGALARRLGYLPLALALAGAQAQDGVTWGEMLAVFRDAQGADVALLDLDDPKMRDESLALTFGLSLERLGEVVSEQFEMLGVFAAGREAPFTVEAAAAVWDVKPFQAKKLLGRLVRAALLNKEGDSYSLHVLLGDYARSRLDEAARQAAEARHSGHYLEVAQRSREEWQATEAALPQMRAARSRLTRDDAQGLLAWAQATSTFFKRRGREIESITWLEAALAAARATGWREQEPWCEIALGDACERLGKPEKALMHYERGLRISRETRDRVQEANALLSIGNLLRRRGDSDAALDSYQTSLAICRETGQQSSEAHALIGIGGIHLQQNELDEALEQFKLSLAIARELGEPVPESMSLGYMGSIYRKRGELDGALEYFQASLSICRQVGERGGEAWMLGNIGRTYLQRGELDDALAKFQASLVIFRGAGQLEGEAASLNSIGEVYRQRGELDEALAQFQASLAIAREMKYRTGQAEALKNIGITYEQMGQSAMAKEHLAQAVALFQTMGMPAVEDVLQDLERVRGQGEEQNQAPPEDGISHIQR